MFNRAEPLQLGHLPHRGTHINACGNEMTGTMSLQAHFAHLHSQVVAPQADGKRTGSIDST